MKADYPLVSIVIPVYNGANFLREAIESALEQTYSNIEILVINDGSNDNGETELIAKSFGEKIRYFYKENGGVATALNLGIAQMRGEYFSWLSHDDLYAPEKIESQMELAAELEDKREIIFSGFAIIDSQGRTLNQVSSTKRYSREQLETPLFALMHGMISGCSLLIHKDNFDRVGLFREDLPTTQDFDLWFRMMRHIPCRLCDGTLHKTRVHDAQGSRVHKAAHSQESDALWIGMMQTLTDEEKIQLNGSVSSFYKNIYFLMLKYTSNREAMKYAKYQFIAVADNPIITKLLLELDTGILLGREVIWISIEKRSWTNKLRAIKRGVKRLLML